MDTRTGQIYTEEQVDTMREAGEDLSSFVGMQRPPTKKQLFRNPPKVGRNEPCPCGSGKKFKKCCLTSEPNKK